MGVVKDSVTGEPVTGATVTDDNYGSRPPRGGTTDARGQYRYTTWPEEHNVVAQAPGYEPQRLALTTSFLGTDTQKVLDFSLVPAENQQGLGH